MKLVLSMAAMAAALAAGASAQATSSFTNGSFEQTLSGLGGINYGGTQAIGWYVPNGGYSFIFDAAAADGSGVANGEYAGGLGLWSTGNGGLDTLAASPDGGNFIAQDGAFEQAPINQDITGLVIGKTYKVGFYDAAAQQDGYTGATTDLWKVRLGGGAAKSTSAIDLPSHGFSGWTHDSFQFVANATEETLSFSAVGAPAGEPPFALLDGVTFSGGVAEPATWAMMILGLGGLGAAARLRRTRSLVDAIA
jgi:hypothetical protein